MEWTPEKVRRALEGDDVLFGRLVDDLTPWIQSGVAGVLVRSFKSRNIREEVKDLVQDTFLHLLEDDGKVLRSWDPSRGLSLGRFIGMVAKRRAYSKVRTGKTCPFKEDPTSDDDLDGEAAEPSPESAAASRELLEHVLDRLVVKLSPMGFHLFDLLFLRRLSPTEVMEKEGMSRAAVDQWVRRIRVTARRILRKLSGDSPDV